MKHVLGFALCVAFLIGFLKYMEAEGASEPAIFWGAIAGAVFIAGVFVLVRPLR